MRKIVLITLALLCLFQPSLTATCPSFYAGDLLQSGIIYSYEGKKALMKGGNSGSELLYQAPISFRVPSWGFQFATTTATISGYNPSGGFNFLVNGRRKGTQNFIQITLIINPSQAWTSVQLSYFASARDDMAVWNGNYDSNTWSRKGGSNIYDIAINVPKNLPQNNYKVAAFLSGFSTTDTQFRISIDQRFYDQRTKILTITINCLANPIPVSIAISYIIYPENHPIFTITYGAPKGDQGAYQISGPTAFSRNIEYNQFSIANRFLVCDGNQCGKTCVLVQECRQLKGNIYQNICKLCPTGVVFEFGNCARRCSGANQYYRNGLCICLDGFARNENNQCVLKSIRCKNNQYKDSQGQCYGCPLGATPNTQQTTCVCPAGQIFDANLRTCVGNCKQNYNWNGNKCICPPGFIDYNLNCIQCPSGSNTNSDQSACTCQSGLTYDPVTNRCIQSCPLRASWNGQRCVCQANYILVGAECVQCPAGSSPNIEQTGCRCNRPGQEYDERLRRCTGGCQRKNQIWLNGQCVCIKGYSLWQNQCRACPANSDPSKDYRTCVCFSNTAIYLPKENLCIECGANATPNPTRTACQCSRGYRLQGSLCVPLLNCQFNEDIVNGRCECKFGLTRVGGACVQRCGVNQYWNGTQCLCNEGTARISGACRPCPSGSFPNPEKTTCLCQSSGQVYVFARNSCVTCPENSFSNGLECVCNPGYTLSGARCVSNCRGQLYPNSNGICICPQGKRVSASGDRCQAPNICPPGSSFNVQRSSCVCNERGQNLIDGSCQSCGQNSVWRGNQCVCQTKFFKIAGECVTCDPRTSYNGKDCVCNLGYFGNKDLCTPCHPSCGQCTGPQAGQCLSCSDFSLALQNGFCSKPSSSACQFGYFLDGSQCVRCIDNCIECQNIFECKTCAQGYAEKKLLVQGQSLINCQQICGDGIKYEQQCDDGNNRDGDGCSSKCQEEKGWFCSGGSSNKPSKCEKYVPDQIQLSVKGAVNLGSEVVISARASFLPSCITKNDCNQCFKALKVNVVDVKVPVLVTVNYIPFSQYQFLIKVDFKPAFVTSIFKVVIKLNPDFKGCFAEEDLFQQFEVTIDPAFLKKYEKEETLCLEDILLAPGPNKPSCINVPISSKRGLGL